MIKNIQITPLNDRVVIQPIHIKESTQTKSGIYIPTTGEKEKTDRGVVVAVGTGRLLDDGTRATIAVSKGDTILFSAYAADEIMVDNEKYYIVREDSILAIVA